MGKTIGVMSLKGGVGKTSIVASLGSALAGFNKKVLLIDANFSAPNLGMHLNIFNPEKTLHHVLDRTANIKEAVHNVGNVDVIPSSMYHNREINHLKLRDRIKHIKRNYDITLIDSSPTLDEESLATMLASDEILVATTPDYPTLSTTIKAIQSAKQRGVPISGLILNKVHNKNFELSIHDIEGHTDIPVMAVIPHDINKLKALSEVTSYTDFKPNSEGSREYKKLAATLIGEKYNPKTFKDFFRKITPPKQEINRQIFYDRVFK